MTEILCKVYFNLKYISSVKKTVCHFVGSNLHGQITIAHSTVYTIIGLSQASVFSWLFQAVLLGPAAVLKCRAFQLYQTVGGLRSNIHILVFRAGILEQSKGARNRVGIGLCRTDTPDYMAGGSIRQLGSYSIPGPHRLFWNSSTVLVIPSISVPLATSCSLFLYLLLYLISLCVSVASVSSVSKSLFSSFVSQSLSLLLYLGCLLSFCTSVYLYFFIFQYLLRYICLSFFTSFSLYLSATQSTSLIFFLGFCLSFCIFVTVPYISFSVSPSVSQSLCLISQFLSLLLYLRRRALYLIICLSFCISVAVLFFSVSVSPSVSQFFLSFCISVSVSPSVSQSTSCSACLFPPLSISRHTFKNGNRPQGPSD